MIHIIAVSLNVILTILNLNYYNQVSHNNILRLINIGTTGESLFSLLGASGASCPGFWLFAHRIGFSSIDFKCTLLSNCYCWCSDWFILSLIWSTSVWVRSISCIYVIVRLDELLLTHCIAFTWNIILTFTRSHLLIFNISFSRKSIHLICSQVV